MIKIVIILSVLALIASCSGQVTKKLTTENANILPRDTTNTTISDTSGNIEREYETFTFEIQYRFEDFPAEIYGGKLSAPDFNNDPYASGMGYVEAMTEECEREGINFGGCFTILQGVCGMCCNFIIMADRKNGQFIVVRNPDGYDNESGAYGYEYRKNSNLLIANSNLLTDEQDELFHRMVNSGLKPKYYVWKNNEFVLLK
jgi:hypothetical protein